MKIKRQTIKTKSHINTIDWYKGEVIDWNSAGTQYLKDGTTNQLQKYHFGFECDRSISSKNGEYALIYQNLRTKGLLLKNGEILREINRSYYQSDAYEFPAVFFDYKGKTYLAHCPNKYCQIDFEEVETGEMTTNIATRDAKDFFHSRLEISPDNKYLVSKGWFWHPFDMIELFDIEQCFENPLLLDKGIEIPNVTAEISSASFIDKEHLLVYTSDEEPMDDENDEPIPPGHTAIWNIKTNIISKLTKNPENSGNVLAINHSMYWDLYKYPKIIELETGTVLDKLEGLFSGLQASSIIRHLDRLPKITYNSKTKEIAIEENNVIEILSVETNVKPN